MKYELYVFGGSIGEINYSGRPRKFFSGIGEGRLYGTYETKAEAQHHGKQYVNSFTGGRKNYYRPRYRVVKVEDKEESAGHIIFSQAVDLRTMNKPKK